MDIFNLFDFTVCHAFNKSSVLCFMRFENEHVHTPTTGAIYILWQLSLNLINDGNIVIAVGGGGIPVIYDNGVLTGVDAVIDKDLSSSLLARLIDFDILLILTNIDKVYLNYNKDNELGLDILCVDDALNYIKDNQFAKGSMLPKIEACINFVKATNKQAIITSLLSAKDALIGKTGTLIK